MWWCLVSPSELVSDACFLGEKGKPSVWFEGYNFTMAQKIGVGFSWKLWGQFESRQVCLLQDFLRKTTEKKNNKIELQLHTSEAVLRSDGFEYLKESCPSLQSELLKAVAGCEEDCSSGGGKSRSVWAQLSDGGDANGRRVRQRT
ncbi:hypothetical protein RJ639_029895 [Escallonia herrerae]|uniref:Uncharacterized protein n=1 Tax=Escallonia herrerae TaxID=1293975 RepID=A0AA88X3B6_9ASTE|nr:hypothetical protein RJ639_029895 [Escallonia herrerae]